MAQRKRSGGGAMTLREFLDNAWRRSAGVAEREPPQAMVSLEELRRTEWSVRFEELMRNRLIQGAFRYKRLRDPAKADYDFPASARAALDRYCQTGNMEELVDAANCCLLAFAIGRHPTKHWSPGDDDVHCIPSS